MFMIGLLIGIVLAPIFIMGVLLILVGLRFKKSAGVVVDGTAFWSNWIAFVWSWAEQSKYIAIKLPFFQKDLTETFGIRPDDGRVT